MVSDDFCEQFTKGVKERDWSVGFRDRIVILFWFWNDDADDFFEFLGPYARSHDGVEKFDQGFVASQRREEDFEMSPHKMVKAWGGRVGRFS